MKRELVGSENMPKDELYLKSVTYKKEQEVETNKYPYNIPIVKDLKKLKFTKRVTFLVGENGIGKSTFIEALAIKLGLNAEGGTENFDFSTRNTHSDLYKYLELELSEERPKTKFFLRAERFYNFASEVENLGVGGYGEDSLHSCSHGETFLQLFNNRFTENGLYILDEPEAALSASRQLTLLYLIDCLSKQGSQFIIDTHSPILIAYLNGEILDLNNNFASTNYTDTEIYQTYKLFIENYEQVQKNLFE